MTIRANVVFTEQVWAEMQRIPKGERSQAVNDAMTDWLLRHRRKLASESIARRRLSAPVTSKAAEAMIREDRDAH